MWIVFLFILALPLSDAEIRYGYKSWTRYEVGNVAIVISAGHGGTLEPPELPTRHPGCLNSSVCVYASGCQPQNSTACRITTVRDSYTLEVTAALVKAMRAAGVNPHVVTTTVKRTKVDMNRAIDEACLGVAECESLYSSFHGFLQQAVTAAGRAQGRVGLYIDIHGQSHKENWTELGYRVPKGSINDNRYDDYNSSISLLQKRLRQPLSVVLTGKTSFGALFSRLGYRVVPSPAIPKPGSGGYYSGGYNTWKYGSQLPNSCMDAIQIELPRDARFSDQKKWDKLGRDLSETLLKFMNIHGYDTPEWRCSNGAMSSWHLDIKILALAVVVMIITKPVIP